MNRPGKEAMRRIAPGAVAAAAVLLCGCGPVEDPSAGLEAGDVPALIEQTPRSHLTPEAIAEAFALNSKSTDVQRQMLEQSLVGKSVEWQFVVYEVAAAENGRFKVTSQAIDVKDPDATPLIRVVAFVQPQGDKDDALLRAVKTGDALRVRGIVQEIRLRTVVVMVPGVVLEATVTAGDNGEAT